MKKTIILSILGFLVFSSCEDVIDVELPETETKLVVDGILRVDESQEFVNVEIKMLQTTAFFDENPPTQVDEAVIIYGKPTENGLFEELFFSNLAEAETGSGVYIPDPNFSEDQRIRTNNVEPGVIFILQITQGERNYYARTEYAPTVPIDNLTQGTETLFDEDDTEVIVTFTDPPGLHDYYIFDFDFGEFLALRDEFIDGQQFQFSYFYDATLEPGEEATVSILGADQEFFNYMDLLVEQTENDGGIFDTPVATVRGNVFDVTGLDNINIFDNVERPEDFALGYFAVVQEFRQTITIQ